MSALDALIQPERFGDHNTAGAHRSVADRPMHLVVATDGRPQSDLALLAARRLSAEEPLDILTVVARAAVPLDDETAEAASERLHRGRVEWQLRRVLGNEVRTSLEIRNGDAPLALATAAASRENSLLVVGVGRPKVSDRLLGDESTLRLVRAAQTPVLAIAPGCALPARRIIIAVDFSPTSLAAAHLAVRLAAPGAEVLLVHVAPRRGEIVWGSGAAGFRGDADLALASLVQRLRPDRAGVLSAVVLHGDPATELIAFAAHRCVDLVAVGAWGHGPAAGTDIGNVTARLVRCASHSVLVVPRCEESDAPSVRFWPAPGTP
jgi:nucleotide-binding universal stress UspA family protein